LTCFDVEVVKEKDSDSEEDLGKDEIIMNNLATMEQSGLPVTEFKHIITVLPLFTCRLNSPAANYRISTNAQRVPFVLRNNKGAKHKAKNIGMHFS
jgi:hypothetical protein